MPAFTTIFDFIRSDITYPVSSHHQEEVERLQDQSVHWWENKQNRP